MSENGNSAGNLLTPKTIMQLGVPTVLTIFFALVITGIIPSPLMRSLTTIEAVHSEQEGVTELLRELLRVSTLQCQWAAASKTDASLCHSPIIGSYQAMASKEYDITDQANGNLNFGGGGYKPE